MTNLFNSILLVFTTLLSSTIGGGTSNLKTVNDLQPNDSWQKEATTTDATDTDNPALNFVSKVGQKISFGIGNVVGGQSEVADVTDANNTSNSSDKVYSDAQLLALAGPKLTTLPLGDGKYVTDAPKQGYIYLCNVHTDNQGAQTNGPWISGTTWLPNNKVSVDGKVTWKNATFKNIISGVKRLLTGNNLPINHTTGTFPINRNSEAGKYDQNPNSIKTQNLSYSISANPTFNSAPTCMGGESGIMLSGVPLFNGFDAENRDAQAHEVQDSCDGHPQEKGEYHYHGLSNCFKDIGEKTVLGFALDGFPITGPEVADGKFLTTKNLDVCHGLTSTIIVDGKPKTTYHYVLTQDFPYSVSCFRGTPIKMGMPNGGQGALNQLMQNQTPPSLPLERGGTGQTGNVPPQPALDACKNKNENTSCTVQTPNGSLSGTCHNTPDGKYFACVPANR